MQRKAFKPGVECGVDNIKIHSRGSDGRGSCDSFIQVALFPSYLVDKTSVLSLSLFGSCYSKSHRQTIENWWNARSCSSFLDDNIHCSCAAPQLNDFLA